MCIRDRDESMERKGCSLKKKTFAACAWMVAMALIVSGCSLFNLGGAEAMDFDAAKRTGGG